MHHRPRKRFGQNFLNNPAIIDAIITTFNPKPTDKVIEIGPGLGALTSSLLQRLNQLTAIEVDRDLLSYLQALPEAKDKLTLLNTDALTVDYSQFGPSLRVIGNLPYNISTPLLLHLLTYKGSLCDMTFMLQKEVVDRLAAIPGTKAYGRLTVMVQYHCTVGRLMDVPPEAFTPAPKVDSAIVYLRPHQETSYGQVDVAILSRVVQQAFSTRRKTLANNLKPILTKEQLLALGIDPSRRPEQLTVTEYVQIAKYIAN